MITIIPDKYEGRDRAPDPPPAPAEGDDKPLRDQAGELLDAVDDNIQEAKPKSDDADRAQDAV